MYIIVFVLVFIVTLFGDLTKEWYLISGEYLPRFFYYALPPTPPYIWNSCSPRFNSPSKFNIKNKNNHLTPKRKHSKIKERGGIKNESRRRSGDIARLYEQKYE